MILDVVEYQRRVAAFTDSDIPNLRGSYRLKSGRWWDVEIANWAELKPVLISQYYNPNQPIFHCIWTLDRMLGCGSIESWEMICDAVEA